MDITSSPALFEELLLIDGIGYRAERIQTPEQLFYVILNSIGLPGWGFTNGFRRFLNLIEFSLSHFFEGERRQVICNIVAASRLHSFR